MAMHGRIWLQSLPYLRRSHQCALGCAAIVGYNANQRIPKGYDVSEWRILQRGYALSG